MCVPIGSSSQIWDQNKQINHFVDKEKETECVFGLPGTVLLQFKDMNRLSVAGGTQELSVCTEGQWTDANISVTQRRDGKGQNSRD